MSQGGFYDWYPNGFPAATSYKWVQLDDDAFKQKTGVTPSKNGHSIAWMDPGNPVCTIYSTFDEEGGKRKTDHDLMTILDHELKHCGLLPDSQGMQWFHSSGGHSR